MAVTRREFVQQTAFAAAAFCGRPVNAVAGVLRRNSSQLDVAAIRKLASEVSGRVITPDTSDYESSRLVFNRAFDRHPALIVRCADASDIARALEFGQKYSLPLAVRGGGHNRAGFSICDDGVVIDLSAMDRVE